MLGTRCPKVVAVLLLVVAASFAIATIEASGFHTDDGCAVELHCFACHWAFASTGVFDALPSPSPTLTAVGEIATTTVVQIAVARVSDLVSRGPPSK